MGKAANRKKKKVEKKIAELKKRDKECASFSFEEVSALDLGIIAKVIAEDFGGVSITFSNGQCLRIFHPTYCCESITLHDDIEEYQSMVGSKLHHVELVQGSGGVGDWYYAKLVTTNGLYTMSFDGDEGTGCYSMEMIVVFYENKAEKCEDSAIFYKGKEMRLTICGEFDN